MSGAKAASAAAVLLRLLVASWASSASADAPQSVVRIAAMHPVAKGVWVVPDGMVPLVPNIGLIEGRDAVLVVDTGLGAGNGAAVRAAAERVAHGRRVLLTTTHFHPEHASGASAFARENYIASAAQAAEIAEKGATLDQQFKTFGSGPARLLQDVRVVEPGRTYTGSRTLDLGGRVVILHEMPAHTLGDQIVEVPDVGVIFAGDLVEGRHFPILYDPDAKGAVWIAVLERLAAMRPRTLVPGHGGVGDVGLIAPELSYLRRLQREVRHAVAAGWTQARTTRTLAPRLAALHPDWQTAEYIPYAIAIFYAEAKHRPPTMPAGPS